MSSRYLLDTSVLSLLAPDRHPAPPAFLRWLSDNTDALYLSPLSIVEIEQGIYKLKRDGPTRRSASLDRWLSALITQFADAVVPLDVPVARAAARLSDQAFADGRHPGLADVAIAATAVQHGFVVLTLNMRHFSPLKVACVDPLAELPR